MHALTDVTGFGLLGHLLEMCRGAVSARTLEFARVPLLPDALASAQGGFVTGASGRNWAGYGGDVDLTGALSDAERALLTDPQTSGGLLVACAPDRVAEIVALFHAEGFPDVAMVGEVVAGAPRIVVR